jgi:hypothetical protein
MASDCCKPACAYVKISGSIGSNSEYSRAPAFARVNGVLRQRLSLVENLSAFDPVCNRTELHYGYFPRILDTCSPYLQIHSSARIHSAIGPNEPIV